MEGEEGRTTCPFKLRPQEEAHTVRRGRHRTYRECTGVYQIPRGAIRFTRYKDGHIRAHRRRQYPHQTAHGHQRSEGIRSTDRTCQKGP